MKIKDRVRELRRVKASELMPNPLNWRKHPKAQQDALRGILAEVGFAGALLARETPDGLQLIDGHLRAETTPDQELPVLVLDVTEEEAKKILVTHDPLAAMAETDDAMLAELLKGVDVDSEAVRSMLDAMKSSDATPAGSDNAESPTPDSMRLAERFGVVPFTVLNAREGWWQDRKRQWLGLGIRSELGRGENLLRFSETLIEPDPVKRAKKRLTDREEGV